MAELIVIGYPSEAEAYEVMGVLRNLGREMVFHTAGTAVVGRSANGDLRLATPHHAVGADAGTGALWGATLSALFFNSMGRVRTGVTPAGLSDDFAGMGIAEEFRRQVFGLLDPARAAVVILFHEATPDRTIEALAPYGGTALRTSLSDDVDEYLRDALARGAAPA